VRRKTCNAADLGRRASYERITICGGPGRPAMRVADNSITLQRSDSTHPASPVEPTCLEL